MVELERFSPEPEPKREVVEVEGEEPGEATALWCTRLGCWLSLCAGWPPVVLVKGIVKVMKELVMAVAGRMEVIADTGFWR